MTKRDLKLGMVLERKDHDFLLYLGENNMPVIKTNADIDFCHYGHECLDELTEDLRYDACDFVDGDIIRVYHTDSYGNYHCLWDRVKGDLTKRCIINVDEIAGAKRLIKSLNEAVNLLDGERHE